MVSTSEIERASARTGSAIWCAWMAAVPAGMILYGMVADSPFVAAMQRDRIFLACWIGVQVGALITGAAIAAGGAPLAWSLLRDGVSNRRRGILLGFCLPIAAVVALVGWVAAVAVWTGGHWAPLPWTVQFANPGWPSETFRWTTGSITAALMILAFASAALSVAQMLRRSQKIAQVRVSVPGAKLILAPARFANFLAPFAAAGFAVVFASVAAWGLVASRNPAFHARLGPLGLTSAFSWLLSTTLFALAAIVSVRSARSLIQT